ncbi:MFS transporter [Streptomyces sp. NPDC059785]|uniref:MFS transporter n=1 Tax=unclassified Streptomyces TaxID=2593676 RepID=UPI0036474112
MVYPRPRSAVPSPARAVPARGVPRPDAFASLRIRNYRIYTLGQSTSVVGNWMQNIAAGWLTLELTHSGTMLGVVTGARYLPVLLLGAWGGLVVDRHDTRRLLTLTQVCFAAQAALLTVVSAAHLVTLPLLVVIMLTLGLTNLFDGPARQKLIGELVDAEHLTNAIAINSTFVNTAKLVGPGVAGFVIAALGVAPCFALDTVSFLAVLASLAMLRTAEMCPADREVRARGQIRAGLTHIRRTPELLYPAIMVYVTGILTWEFPVSLPLLTTSAFHSGPAGYGAATALMSAGGVLGGFVAVRRRRLSTRSLSVSAVVWGVLICAAALAPTLPVALVLLVLVGVGSITFNSSAKTLMQVGAAPQMRGRVMAIWSIGWMGGTVIGAPVVGTAGALWGARTALLVGGLAAAGVGAAVLILSSAGPAPGACPSYRRLWFPPRFSSSRNAKAVKLDSDGNGVESGAKASGTRYSQAYEGLRTLLLSGSMAPGTRLTEADLTRMFNVSRSTMRTALARLTQEGYVTSEVNRGVRTRSFTVEEAADILEARETLESALAGKAAERATDEEIAELRQTLEEMEQAQARGDQDAYSRGNRRFHQQIKHAAHQHTLARAYDTLLYPLVMRQYRNLAAPHPRTGSLEEHQVIFLAILTRNPDAAIAAMRHHVGSARRALLLDMPTTPPTA